MEKVYYKIREVSQMLGLTYATLRFWEHSIPQLQPHKPEGKTTRYYTKEDIELIRKIKFLREEQNLPIDVVIKRLQNESSGVDARMRAINELEKIKKELIEIRATI